MLDETQQVEQERFCRAWELVRTALPCDALSWEIKRHEGIGVRVVEDTSTFSYGSSIYVNFNEKRVYFSNSEFRGKAEKIVSVFVEDNSFGRFSLEEIK